MFPRIRQCLAPPVFQDDKDKTRLAGLPLKIFLTTIVLPVILGLFVLVIEPDPVLLLAFASIWLSLALGRLFMIYHITQHKQTEKALQESEERYRVVVEDQTEVISRFKADGIVLFVNDVYCCFFGKSSQELLGQKWQPVAVPEDIPGIEEKLKTLSPTNPVVINENRVYSGRGQVHWMQFINRGFFNQQGQLVEIQSVGRDITERKQIEEALRRAHDELEVRVARRTAELQRTNQALEKEIIERQRAANQRQHLLEFSRALLTTFSLDQRVELTRIALTDHVPHDAFAPYWLEEATGLLQPMETKGRHWFSTPEAWRWPIPVGRGILGDVAQHGQAEYVNNAHLDPRSIYPPGRREQIEYEHLMALPLWGPEKMIGIVALSRVTLPPFMLEEFELAQLFMSQAALTWHNARLYAETRRRLQEQTALCEAGMMISATLDLETVLHRIAEQLGRIVEATSVFISSYDPETITATIIAQYISPQACPEEQAPVLGVTYDLAQVFPDDIELLQTGHPKVRYIDDPMVSIQQREHLAQYGCQTVLDIPMQIGGRSIAYVSIWESRGRREFTTEEIALCQAIAQQGAISLQNARLHQAKRARYREAEALRQAALALTSTVDLNQLLEYILTELQHVVPYDSASVQLLKGDYLEIIGGRGFNDLAAVIGAHISAHWETSPNTYVISSLEPIIIEDVKVGSLTLNQEIHGAPSVRAWLGVPLVINNCPIGVITLHKHQPNFYTQAHAQIALAYAAQAAIALDNARLYGDLRNQMQALQAAQAQLVQSERMAALGRLIASIAHEINNPLQAIQGFFNLLTEEVSDRRRPEKIDHYLTIAGSEIERITGIINRMRTFYRPASYIQPQPDSADDFFRLAQTESQAVDLHAILESVLQLVNKKLQQENVKVERVWAKGLILLPANPDFLKQVFLNLTLNAIDAMAERGGTLRIETRLDQASFGHDRPHPAVRVEFSDTGVGMSPEVLSRLFEPLFSTKEQGSGFGLFTSYQIIQAHQGQITATSRLGEGTTFTILLPLK